MSSESELTHGGRQALARAFEEEGARPMREGITPASRDMAECALRVLVNDARRHAYTGERGGAGLLVRVFDAKRGFWRTGTIMTLGRKWATVRTPARTFKVLKEQVRPMP